MVLVLLLVPLLPQGLGLVSVRWGLLLLGLQSRVFLVPLRLRLWSLLLVGRLVGSRSVLAPLLSVGSLTPLCLTTESL